MLQARQTHSKVKKQQNNTCRSTSQKKKPIAAVLK